MREKLTVIKVGGKIVEEEATLLQLLNDFAAISGHKVLVHGGGRSATKIAAQLGIESKMVNGRRITDAETLKVVTMVYGGLVNKNIVAGLQARGVNALGLTGADMNVIRSVKRPVKEVDYGFTYIIAPILDNLYQQFDHKLTTALCIVLLFSFSVDFIYSSFFPNTGEGITKEIYTNHNID